MIVKLFVVVNIFILLYPENVMADLITLEAKKHIKVKPGDSIQFSCKSDKPIKWCLIGIPGPKTRLTYQFKSQRQSTPDLEYNGIGFDKGDCSYIIHSVNASMSGRIHCTYSRGKKNEFVAIVQEKPSKPVFKPNPKGVFYPGSILNVSCEAAGGNPKPIVNIFLNGIKLKSSVKNSARVVYVLKKSDHNKRLTCRVKHPAYNKGFFSITRNLKINLKTTKCGIMNQPKKLIVGGSDTKNIPWHAGIYRIKGEKSFEYICGATIIAPKVLLSAAHCFWNKKNNNIISAEMFIVGIGTHYKLFIENDNTKNIPGTYEIIEIKIHPGFKGHNGDFEYDIAVLILEESVKFNSSVGAACIDSNDGISLKNSLGMVSGWGLMANNILPNALQSINLPVVTKKECLQNNTNFSKYLNSDKFCAGFPKGPTGCLGDSGSGFMVRNKDNRWYIKGIVSFSVNEDPNTCKSYVVFTKINSYITFINKQLADSKKEEKTTLSK